MFKFSPCTKECNHIFQFYLFVPGNGSNSQLIAENSKCYMTSLGLPRFGETFIMNKGGTCDIFHIGTSSAINHSFWAGGVYAELNIFKKSVSLI